MKLGAAPIECKIWHFRSRSRKI